MREHLPNQPSHEDVYRKQTSGDFDNIVKKLLQEEEDRALILDRSIRLAELVDAAKAKEPQTFFKAAERFAKAAANLDISSLDLSQVPENVSANEKPQYALMLQLLGRENTDRSLEQLTQYAMEKYSKIYIGPLTNLLRKQLSQKSE